MMLLEEGLNPAKLGCYFRSNFDLREGA